MTDRYVAKPRNNKKKIFFSVFLIFKTMSCCSKIKKTKDQCNRPNLQNSLEYKKKNNKNFAPVFIFIVFWSHFIELKTNKQSIVVVVKWKSKSQKIFVYFMPEYALPVSHAINVTVFIVTLYRKFYIERYQELEFWLLVLAWKRA